jgi:hypothetical protein
MGSSRKPRRQPAGIEELKPTWHEEGPCDILEYPRGTFSDDGACGGHPAEQLFDDAARADLDRILDAVEQSGVPTKELTTEPVAPHANLSVEVHVIRLWAASLQARH